MALIPIWKDTYIFTSDYDYEKTPLTVKLNSTGKTIYSGVAYNRDYGHEPITARINDICADYLSSLHSLSEAELNAMDLPPVFHVQLGDKMQNFQFIEDWSYDEDYDPEKDGMSFPINGHADPRMWLPYTSPVAVDGIQTTVEFEDGDELTGTVGISLPDGITGDFGSTLRASAAGTALVRMEDVSRVTFSAVRDYSNPGGLQHPVEVTPQSGTVISYEDADSGYITDTGEWSYGSPSGVSCGVYEYTNIGGQLKAVYINSGPAPVSGASTPSVMAAAFDAEGSLLETFNPVQTGTYSGIWNLPAGTDKIYFAYYNSQIGESRGALSTVVGGTSVPFNDDYSDWDLVSVNTGDFAYYSNTGELALVTKIGSSINIVPNNTDKKSLVRVKLTSPRLNILLSSIQPSVGSFNSAGEWQPPAGEPHVLSLVLLFSESCEISTIETEWEGYNGSEISRITFPTSAYKNIGECRSHALYYRNAYGGWDAFLVEGTVSERDALTRHTMKRPYDNRQTSSRGTYNFSNEITKSWNLKTGWLSDEESGLMHHLLNSTEVWLHDLVKDKIYPVVLTSTETEHKTYRTNGNRMNQYEIEVQLAQERERR